MGEATTSTGKLNCYVSRALLRRLATAPQAPVLTRDGTVVFVDISGFTRLSERLARGGREGAEQVVDTINSCFTALLAEAYGNGGSLLKFGGDAMLLWFEGEAHTQLACASAVAMRRMLRQVGRIMVGASEIVLRMSVGVHSGGYSMFLVGGSHREFLIAGPSVSTVVAMEAAASAGQILVSHATARRLPQRCLGAASESGVLLARAPATPVSAPDFTAPSVPDDAVAACLPTEVRAHVAAAPVAPEHRTATVAFLQYGCVDAIIAGRGPQAAAAAIEEVICTAQAAADQYEVCFLESDIAIDGGKVLFSAGAPRAVGDDEERMLLAMRQIIDADCALPVRIGVNRGYTFTGELGPPYRRTYVVMGDVTNLAARLCAKARWGGILATERIVGCSRTRFAAQPVAPFMVKGKRRPIEAFDVGPAMRAAGADVPARRLPLIGRDGERAILERSLGQAAHGRGGAVEVVGEPGSGKSRLLTEACEMAGERRTLRLTCEAYTRAVPYYVSRDLLRQLLGPNGEDSDALTLEQLRGYIQAHCPHLLPMLPLVAVAAGIEAPSTREVDELAPQFRAARLHEVVLEVIERALLAPTLLLVEHAHHMDDASAGLFEALAARVTRSPWLMITTRRDGSGGFVVAEDVGARVELEPLTPEATLALAEATPEAHVVPPHTLKLAVDRAAGNPEYLLDLLAAAASGSETLPDTLETAASARIDALDPGDRVLIRRAAVLGLTFRPEQLVYVLPEGTPPPDQTTWQRLAAVFAVDADGHLRWRRPALCEAAYEGLPFRVRRELHATVGRVLEADVGRDVDSDPAVLSLHFSRAGDHERAWRYALMGAERATAVFAHGDAARLYRRGVESGRAAGADPRKLAETFEALGEALRQAGERQAANDAYTSSRKLFAGSPIDEARLCYRHSVAAERASSAQTVVRWAKRGLRILEHFADDEARRLRAQLLSALGSARQWQRRLRQAEQTCREAIEVAEAVGELRALAHACYVLDQVLVEDGRFDEATHSLRALDIYRALGELERESWVLNNLGAIAYWRGEWDQAIELYTKQAECSQRAGNPSDVAYTDCNVGEILSDQGLLDQAMRRLQRARRVWSSTREATMLPYIDLQIGRVAARDGRYEEALTTLTSGAARLRQLGAEAYASFADSLIAEAEAFGGDPERALALVDQLLALTDRYAPLLHRVRGISYARMGANDAAAGELRQALRLARQRDAHYDRAATLDVMARVIGLDDREIAERDAGLARLHIAALPSPVLSPIGWRGHPSRVPSVV